MRFGRLMTALTVLCGVLSLSPYDARATTAVLFDAETGQVLHAERADQRWYPASITKLMTAYVAFEVLKVSPRLTENTMVKLSEHANMQEPTKLWLKTGAQLDLKTAMGAMIVKSANDAAVMVAEAVGGELASFTRYGACRPGVPANRAAQPAPDPMTLFHSRSSGMGAARFDEATGPWSRCRYAAFTKRMNQTAQRLGMTSTVFVNANGLPDARQVTTARDFAHLTRALVLDFPQYAPVFAARSMRYSRGRLRSYNRLLRTFTGADGMKTGFICAAGYNIVASATQNGRRLVAVVLGWSQASRRNARASELLAHGFRIPSTHFGPHDMTLSELVVSGDAMTPPPDIRASLRSRSCRRRIRFEARIVKVRALDGMKTVAGKTRKDGKVALTGSTVKRKTKSRTASVRPKPKRVSPRKKKRVVRKKAVLKKLGVASSKAASGASER